jgi:hypothetical protein
VRVAVGTVLALVGLLVALIIVLVLVGTDEVTVGSRAELAHVELGRPWPVLVQDQAVCRDPPLPTSVVLDSYLECPVRLHRGPLVAQVLLIWAVLAGVLGTALLVVRRVLRWRSLSRAAPG